MISWKRKNRAEGKGMVSREAGELCYLTFPAFTETGLVEHLFSTRMGGVSKGIFATMNLSFTRGDEEAAVQENFRRIAKVMHGKKEDFVCSDQTHTVIGLAHSGWRGTVNRMGREMTAFMEKEYGCRKEDMIAAVGPSICADCYEVSEDVADAFRREFGEDVLSAGREEGKYQLDLWRANEKVLLDAGLTGAQISVTDICTCCNEDKLFSHRASKGKRGNLGAFLSLRE